MKSIKEKAIEYNKKINYIVVGNIPNKDFVTGANYVLDAIENILSHPTYHVNSYKSVEEDMLDEIVECIEQLKK